MKAKIDELYSENLDLKKENSENNRKVLEVGRENQEMKRAVNERTQELEKTNSDRYKLEQ